jgi:hypothetical protein
LNGNIFLNWKFLTSWENVEKKSHKMKNEIIKFLSNFLFVDYIFPSQHLRVVSLLPSENNLGAYNEIFDESNIHFLYDKCLQSFVSFLFISFSLNSSSFTWKFCFLLYVKWKRDFEMLTSLWHSSLQMSDMYDNCWAECWWFFIHSQISWHDTRRTEEFIQIWKVQENVECCS